MTATVYVEHPIKIQQFILYIFWSPPPRRLEVSSLVLVRAVAMRLYVMYEVLPVPYRHMRPAQHLDKGGGECAGLARVTFVAETGSGAAGLPHLLLFFYYINLVRMVEWVALGPGAR